MENTTIEAGDRVKRYGQRGTVVHVYKNKLVVGADIVRIAWDSGREDLRAVREVELSTNTNRGIRAVQKSLRESRQRATGVASPQMR